MQESQTESQNHNGGVKTAEGKAVTRYNAQKHAILRETLTDYERVDAEEIFNDIVNEICPTGRIQELLVENLVSNFIRLQRIAKAEAEHVSSCVGEPKLNMSSYNSLLDAGDVEKLLLYSRYQTATENRIFRSILLLKQLSDHE